MNNLSKIQEKINTSIATLSEKTENKGQRLLHRSDGTTDEPNNTTANTDDTPGTSTATNNAIGGAVSSAKNVVFFLAL